MLAVGTSCGCDSMRRTRSVPPPATQTTPLPAATPFGRAPTGIAAALTLPVRPSIAVSVPSALLETNTVPLDSDTPSGPLPTLILASSFPSVVSMAYTS